MLVVWSQLSKPRGLVLKAFQCISSPWVFPEPLKVYVEGSSWSRRQPERKNLLRSLGCGFGEAHWRGFLKLFLCLTEERNSAGGAEDGDYGLVYGNVGFRHREFSNSKSKSNAKIR